MDAWAEKVDGALEAKDRKIVRPIFTSFRD
jgi:hypothetical protein